MKLVGAALGDDIEDTASGLAILGAVGTGLDFDFLNKLKWKVRTRSAKSRVGSVNTIQNVVVLGTPGSKPGRPARPLHKTPPGCNAS
ncbi:MAG TPA: hypothetical protein VK475_05390, partial [Pyrinomonadaceae bacterium]|nr:hypothetical protein [Pyrinomonadaceae bacterium]